jgi:hypothetical protein
MTYWVIQYCRTDPEQLANYEIGPFKTFELAERFVAQAILSHDNVHKIVGRKPDCSE